MSYPYHSITYPDGRQFVGKVNRQREAEALGLDLKGLSVLDIATNDGFFAFWAEQQGASRVVAIDVGSYEKYDWGFDGPPQEIKTLGQQDKWEWFDIHHRNLNSNVVKKEMSIYDIESLGETFDVIFNYGLLYHLRHPVLALDKCRAVCKGFAVVETAMSAIKPHFPVSIESGELSGVGTFTDTYLPTSSCLASWMKKACFPEVFVQKTIYRRRTTAIGVVDPKYLDWFSQHDRCDSEYWGKVKEVTASLLR